MFTICCFASCVAISRFCLRSPNWLQMRTATNTLPRSKYPFKWKTSANITKNRNKNEYQFARALTEGGRKSCGKLMKLRKMNVCVKLRGIEFSGKQKMKEKKIECTKYDGNNMHHFIGLTLHTITRFFFFQCLTSKLSGNFINCYPFCTIYFHVNIHIYRFDIWIFHFWLLPQSIYLFTMENFTGIVQYLFIF